jgi:hypothetical protein
MEGALPMSQTKAPALPPRLAGNSAVPYGRMPPATGAAASSRLRFRIRTGYVVLALVLCLPLLCAIGIARCFRLSSATAALRTSVMESVPGQWDKRLAVHVGGFTLGLVRLGSRLFNLPPEPKAALETFRGAEVGVYSLQDARCALDYSAMFTAADKSMRRQGWERIVGVVQGRQFVAVYVPRNLRSVKRMACCVAVLNEQDLVVVSASGNLEPLLELATQHLQEHDLPLGQRLPRSVAAHGWRTDGICPPAHL